MKQFLPILFLALATLSNTNTRAQTVKWGEAHDITCFEPVIHDGFCYAVNMPFTGFDFFIEKYDPKTNLVVKRREFTSGEVSSDGAGIYFITRLISSPHGLMLICQNSGRDTTQVLFQVNTETLGIEKKLFTTKQLEAYSAPCFIQSKNNEFVCIYSSSNTGFDLEKSVSKIKISVLKAENAILVYETEVSVNKEEGVCKAYNLCVANNGDVLITFGYEKQNTHRTSLVYVSNGSVVSSTPFVSSDSYLNVGVFCETSDGIFVIGNYNTGDENPIWSTGWYCSNINTSTKKVAYTNTHPFPKNVYSIDKSGKKGFIGNLMVKDILRLSNGELRVVFEKFQPNSNTPIGFMSLTGSAPKEVTGYRTWHYPGIWQYKFVCGINNDGTKKFETIVTRRGSFINDQIKMLEGKDNGVVIFYESGKVAYTLVTKDGVETTKEISDSHSMEIQPKAIRKIDNETFLLYYWKSAKKATYGTLTFD